MSRHAEIDFGFSLVDEEDLANKDYERELEDKLQAVDHTAGEYKKRMLAVRDVVMPLLMGLTKDPPSQFSVLLLQLGPLGFGLLQILFRFSHVLSFLIIYAT